MNNLKITSGQWIKGTNTSKNDWMKIYCNNKCIATVHELSKKGQRKATDFDEEGANANLISHAPELLKMTYDLMKCIQRLTADHLTQLDRDLEAEHIGEAHELLMKINPDYYNNANKKFEL